MAVAVRVKEALERFQPSFHLRTPKSPSVLTVMWWRLMICWHTFGHYSTFHTREKTACELHTKTLSNITGKPTCFTRNQWFSVQVWMPQTAKTAYLAIRWSWCLVLLLGSYLLHSTLLLLLLRLLRPLHVLHVHQCALMRLQEIILMITQGIWTETVTRTHSKSVIRRINSHFYLTAVILKVLNQQHYY